MTYHYSLNNRLIFSWTNTGNSIVPVVGGFCHHNKVNYRVTGIMTSLMYNDTYVDIEEAPLEDNN